MENLQPAHLRIDGVSKRFDSVLAVDNVRLDIPQGAFATLLGPSGCGKTTLLRMIAGFYDVDQGAIYLNDRRIDDMAAHERGTAMVFQDYALFPHMKVYDNVSYGLKLAKVPTPEVRRRVAETLEFVGLTGLQDRWPDQLSGGQQQRVALARALIVRPKVLLLDEPLSNLDANLRERMRWELRSLQQQLMITFVYVTHDQSEALAMSDWIAVMKAGQVMQWGPPWEIYYHPSTTFLAEFVGAANLRTVPITEHEGGSLVVTLDGQCMRLRQPGAPVSGEALLCIRPESIAIGTAPAPAPWVSVPGVVARRAFLGHIMRYWIKSGDFEWLVDQSDPGSIAHPYDGPVYLSINPDRVHVIA
jgi:ABC-type Fe3+/spermidine/putrescine transport system ATPase subunit